MKFSLLDDSDDGKYNGFELVKISRIFDGGNFFPYVSVCV